MSAVVEREPQVLTGADLENAARAAAILAEHLQRLGDAPAEVQMQVQTDRDRVAFSVPVPALVLRMLAEILAQMARGNPVRIVPYQAELTTQQAAELLNVSRPFVVKLLEERALPFRKVGPRRRIRFSDVIAFKRADDARQKEVAGELTAEGERLGLGY